MTGKGAIRWGTVLVVEDDEGLRHLIARRLAAAGLEVAEAATAAECLALVDLRPVDLLIVDYSLPDFSAPALLDRLAATGRVIPFLVATGQGNEQVAVEMMRRGARDYLVKDRRFLDRLPDVTLRILDQIDAERRLAEAERARALTEQRLRRLVENLGDRYFLYETDTGGRLTFASPSAKVVLGYEVDEVLQLYSAFLTDHPMNAEARSRTEAGTRGEQQPPYIVEVRHRDGSPRCLEVQEVPVLDATGAVAFVAGTARDVTRERELEHQLLRSQRMEAMGTLAGGVSHDFNNLLTVIGGFNEVALGFIPEGHPAREALEEICAATGRASAVTQQLLAFSRKQVVQPRVIEPNVLVSRMARMLRTLLGEDIELVCELAEEAPWIVADPGQMEQVIMNLAVNGRDAMPSGGRLTIQTRRLATAADWPDPPSGPSAEFLLLDVSDSGHGMDPETLAHAFDPFFTTKEQGKGTGLGLATVQGIAEQAGGRVRLLSHSGEGTRCQLLFPAARQDQISSESFITVPALPIPSGYGEQVLVVEDDRALLNLTCCFLRSVGYRVVPAADATEALSRMAELGGEIDLVVSDVILPKLSGPELVERIRASWPELPALFVSGYAADKLRDAGTSLPDVALLAKPFSRAGILAAVRLALDNKRAEAK